MSEKKGCRRSHGHHSYNNKINVGDKGREVLEKLDENSPIVQQFRAYASELDDKHDRFERLVNLSRDITIRSKRIIFLLHTLDKESKRGTVINEAMQKLDSIRVSSFKSIAQEIDGQDIYQYLRAYCAGLEEYVEAATFHHYLQNGNLEDWTELEKSLVYPMSNKGKDVDQHLGNNNAEIKTLSVSIIPTKYILGIADLTGELMRKCILNLATGDISSCYQTCNFVRSIYKGFLGCSNNCNREMNKKLYTLKQSLTKMENVCYTIKMRCSEIPKHMLLDAVIVAAEKCTAEDDEGYQVY